MPHQCLKCGKIFEEGTSDILKGCSDCGGNRFFFTKEPLNEKERDEITLKVGKDLNSKIVDLLGIDRDNIIDKTGKWKLMKPKDVRKAFEQHLNNDINKKNDIKNKKEKPIFLLDDNNREFALEKIKSEIKTSDSPETIDIEKPGKYRIDLKGLLEEEPIIIQKDGTYTIHLPSIFKMIDKEKDK